MFDVIGHDRVCRCVISRDGASSRQPDVTVVCEFLLLLLLLVVQFVRLRCQLMLRMVQQQQQQQLFHITSFCHAMCSAVVTTTNEMVVGFY